MLPLLLTLLLTTVQVPAQQSAIAPAATTKLPLDPAVTTGTLPNGLTYYIRKNERPDDRVLLQLAVKAGSIDEEDDQKGLAHFLEHMAFNGSRNFKPGELIAAFEATGARMGPHVNAYTSFDETVYMLQLPTDKEGLVRRGLVALSDFAGGLTLDPAEIDKERGVVIEEWRSGLGAGSRIRDKQVPVLYHGSKYAERLPIGDPEVLKKFSPARLRAFYEKWYRPDRIAVVIVGDVDPAEMVRLVRETFGDLKKPAAAAPPRRYPIPLHNSLLVNVATDPEVTQSGVSLVRKHPGKEDDTVADYRRGRVQQLVSQMINERFDELSRKPDAKFLGAGAYGGELGADVETFSFGASAPEGTIPDALSSLAVEEKRVLEHGFGAGEFDRAKKWMLAFYERAYAERDKTESSSFAREYVSLFLTREPSPGIEYEYKLVQQLLPTITQEEVTAAAKTLLSTRSRVVLATSPEKKDLPVPDRAALEAVLASADKVAVTPWTDTASTRALMESVPDPGEIVERRENAKLGVTIVRFKNGVEAWLKPTNFKNDEVLFSFTAAGGSSLAPPERYFEAVLSRSLVELSGVGGHSAVELQRLLAGKLADASPVVSLSTHGITGSATPAQLETGLQLLHQTFLTPGNDAEAFTLLTKQLDAAVMNRAQNPNAVFFDRVNQINTSNHYTSQPLTLERVRALDRAAITSFYKDAFSNAANFTLFMVGAFTVDEALPLVARYVGSLPSTPGTARSKYKDLNLTFPKEVVKEVVQKGREPRSQTVVSFFADPGPEEVAQSRLSAATEVLEIALRDVMREELGQTYNVSVGTAQPLPQRGAGRVVVSFTASPENVNALVDRVLKEVTRLQQEGPGADLTTRAKEAARREHEVSMKQNGYWLSRLQTSHILGRDPEAILTRLDRIEALTAEVLQQAFREYFPLQRYTAVTLMPEK